jgi:hypothetical protein
LLLYTHNGQLYIPSMPPLHKEIRKAIEEALSLGLTVRQFSGHTWGQVECSCGAHIKIYSTGTNPEFGAKLIRKFIQRHRDHQGGKP